jgi:hypothetical protein
MPRKLPRPAERGPIPGYRDIGRNTIFGNPYYAADPLGGQTIPHFKTYLKKRMNNEPLFREQLISLAKSSDRLWCPGCGPRGKNCVGGVCHGGTIIDALEFMINNPDFKFANRGRLSLADLLDPTMPRVNQFVDRYLR